MKKLYVLSISIFFIVISSFSQQEKGIYGNENWLNNWTEFKPTKVEYNKPTQILRGVISKDKKLLKKEIYLLSGDVYITNNSTLFIEPGTVILGDFKTNGSLIITNGSRIVADGSETDPIVFTSSQSVKKAGDWGGIFLLGNAPTNKFGNKSSINKGLRPSSFEHILYGGYNAKSNSGILNYVRIEFAGKRTKNYGYFDALTLAGVGYSTIIENVMVSYSYGNSFNVIGGELELNKLISFRCSDKDYVFNYGTQCKISNSLAVRSPYISRTSSQSFYVASYEHKDEVDLTEYKTLVNAQNLTLLNNSKNINHDISVGLVSEALYIKPHAILNMDNTVISGFNPAVILDNKISVNSENLNQIQFTRMYFNNCNGNIFVKNISNNEDLENWYGNRIFQNVYSKGLDVETFIASKNYSNPDFRLRINKILASND